MRRGVAESDRQTAGAYWPQSRKGRKGFWFRSSARLSSARFLLSKKQKTFAPLRLCVFALTDLSVCIQAHDFGTLAERPTNLNPSNAPRSRLAWIHNGQLAEICLVETAIPREELIGSTQRMAGNQKICGDPLAPSPASPIRAPSVRSRVGCLEIQRRELDA